MKKYLNQLTFYKVISIIPILIFFLCPAYLTATEERERSHSNLKAQSSVKDKERNLQPKESRSIHESARSYFRAVTDEGNKAAFSKLKQLRVKDEKGYAQHYLGCLYEDGVEGIIDKSLCSAARHYYEATQKGHKGAFNALTRLGENDEEGFAQRRLGCLYRDGVAGIVDKSFSKAATCYSGAVKKGHKTAFTELEQLGESDKEGHAQYYLGCLHEGGVKRIVNKSLRSAARYYYKAAQRNHEAAFTELKRLGEDNEEGYIYYYIGKIYEDEFEKNEKSADLKEAVYWYSQAASQNDDDALEKIANLVKKECGYINGQIIKGHTLEHSIGHLSFFRGIHYVTNLFKEEDQIIQNVSNNDLNIFLVSSAACTLAGSTFLSDTPSEEELEAGKLIYDILSKFKKKHGPLYDKFHETYTNNHKTFHDLLEDPEKASDSNVKKAFTTYRRIFREFAGKNKNWQEAVERNPFVSFSCNARHGLRYSLGQKSFTGGDDVKLLPEYGSDGKPKNKHLGRLYGAIFHPSNILDLDPTFVLDKYARNRITVKTNYNNDIFSEKEISFFGYLPQDLIQISEPINVPSFSASNYPRNYEEDFGISQQKY